MVLSLFLLYLYLVKFFITKLGVVILLFLCKKMYFYLYINMKVLTTSSSSQTFKIIPREYVTSATLKVTDDSKDKLYSYSVTPSTDGNYLSVSNVYTHSSSGILKEGRFYDITLENASNKVIYKDKIFVTDQTINQETNTYYDMNDGDYTTEDSYDNEYIII